MSFPPDPLYQDEADWRGLKHIIRKAFGRSYVEYNLLRAKATWYELHYMWKEYSSAVFKLYAIRCPDFTNKQECQNVSIATTVVLLYIKDHDHINQAIIWADTLMKATKWYKSDCIDTYAKLLYKSGRTPDAIKWQTEAVKLEPANKSHLAALRKMIKGEPIYGVTK